MGAASQREAAGLGTGGAGARVAAVGGPTGVVAGGRAPAGLSTSGGLGVPLSSAGNTEDRRTAGTPNLHHLGTGVAAPWVADGGTLVVPTAHRPTAALVTWGAVTRATLPPALVFLAASCFGTFGVTEILFMTRHQLLVFTTPAGPLHLLSAGVTAPPVAPH